MKPRTTAAETAGQPSMLASMLAGEVPAMPVPVPGAVRQHRLDNSRPGGQVALSVVTTKPGQKPREFTAPDKALIRKVHGYMAPLQLLGILNERLVCDVGDSATLYNIDQLKAEIASVTTAVPVTGNDWGTLRKLLANARREGVLDLINEQVIDDFAVVYSLSQKQVLTLKDILLNQEDDE